jgi:hypothetical protein
MAMLQHQSQCGPRGVATNAFKTEGPLSRLVRPDSAQSLEQQPRNQKVERKIGRVCERGVDVVYATGHRKPSDEGTGNSKGGGYVFERFDKGSFCVQSED